MVLVRVQCNVNFTIKEWTGMEFGDSLRAAEDRERWKGIVATSSVVPRRPSRQVKELR